MLQTREMFNKIHKRYDMLNHLMSAGRDIAWRKKCCKKLPKKENAVVLDLCGGTGDFSLAFKKILGDPKFSIVGDFAGKMLSVAAQKSPDLIPVQMDATDIPLADGSVDIILNGFGMRNIKNLDLAFSEAFRVLKQGGSFATLEFFKPEKKIATFFYQKIAPLAIPFAGMMFSKRNAYRYLVLSILSFITSKEYAAKARAAGFALRSIKSLDGGLAHMVLLEKK
ncbi:MAG: ubiquinone/menaquinone biosynthesis methyltransferase [Fibromonadaceae bacterium]|jgi:demethylmenaquinone methyltransferase/2-methoxy-6-polyprenyl-1,4-benzoquinol methylase|nr:ubiquinone/menaquinone biosynthesis methyltransferase [Fibromonadaceae bacterium]